MKLKDTRPKYEPPKVRDLSGFTSGGDIAPTGFCAAGDSVVWVNCPGGSTPGGTLCTAGTGPDFQGDPCSPLGISPEYGYCNPSGGFAIEGCDSGGNHI